MNGNNSGRYGGGNDFGNFDTFNYQSQQHGGMNSGGGGHMAGQTIDGSTLWMGNVSLLLAPIIILQALNFFRLMNCWTRTLSEEHLNV